MNRRQLMFTAAAFALAPAAGIARDTAYVPGMVRQALGEGKTVFLDFAADWCSTCAAQERKIAELRRDNPAYDAHITFIRVNWDAYHDSEISRALNIPRRSTLVVLKGDREVGRVVAKTRTSDLKALLDLALEAALTA